MTPLQLPPLIVEWENLKVTQESSLAGSKYARKEEEELVISLKLVKDRFVWHVDI